MSNDSLPEHGSSTNDGQQQAAVSMISMGRSVITGGVFYQTNTNHTKGTRCDSEGELEIDHGT